METNSLSIPTVAEMMAKGESPEILFWVGCAGSFDDRAQRITRALCAILNHVGIRFAILGTEEHCTGDPAKRAGNEFLFQMQAMLNIETLNDYQIKKIVTACPHCFNTLKNEYPALGGNYEVMHHSQLLQELTKEGKLLVREHPLQGKEITFHDPCYLGRGNGIYEAPRALLEALGAELREMKRCKGQALCCGAGGAQLFKEPEPGNQAIQAERITDALETGAPVIASACPFCMTMLRDGLQTTPQEREVQVLDIAEITAKAQGLI